MFKWLKIKSRKQQWSNLMSVMGLQGFQLVNMKEIQNGHILTISIPPNSSFEDFVSKKANFVSYFKGLIEFEEVRFSDILQMKIITKDIGQYEFEPVKPPSPLHIYLGKTFDGKPYFIDLKTDAHILIAGKNGGGKSFELAVILANILYFQSKYFEIYLCQTVKRDIDYLKNCKGVKLSVYTPLETAAILEKAFNEINRRAELFAEMGVRGIDHYNEVSGHTMKRKLYVFEEISLYMADNTDSEEEQLEKSKVWTLLWKLVKTGREVGINVFMLTQRTTAKNLGGDGEIKSQLTRMTFYQAQEIDSRNVIDRDYATKLKKLECYVLDTNGLTLLKVPFLKDGLVSLKKYVPEIIAYEKGVATSSVKTNNSLYVIHDEVKFKHIPREDNTSNQEDISPKTIQDTILELENKKIDEPEAPASNEVIKHKKRIGVEFEC